MKVKSLLCAVALSSLFLPDVAVSLSAQGANLSNCAASLGEHYSTEEAYRLCKLRRNRSLLYKGSATCPGGASPTAPSACHPEDSAGQFTDNEHEPTATLQPVMRGDMASIYAGRQFTYSGATYRINESGHVQIYKNRHWRFRCDLDFEELGCIYAQGSNSRSSSYSPSVTCEYEFLRFEPDLFRMAVTRGTSAKKYRWIEGTHYLMPGRTLYFCQTDTVTNASIWR